MNCRDVLLYTYFWQNSQDNKDTQSERKTLMSFPRIHKKILLKKKDACKCLSEHSTNFYIPFCHIACFSTCVLCGGVRQLSQRRKKYASKSSQWKAGWPKSTLHWKSKKRIRHDFIECVICVRFILSCFQANKCLCLSCWMWYTEKTVVVVVEREEEKSYDITKD